VAQQHVADLGLGLGRDFLPELAVFRVGQHRGNELRGLQLQLGQSLLQQLVALHQLDGLDGNG